MKTARKRSEIMSTVPPITLPWRERLLAAVTDAQARPDLHDERDARFLRDMRRMLVNGQILSAKQAWAIEAIQRRVARGEKRDGTKVQAPTPSPVNPAVQAAPAASKPAAMKPAKTDASRLPENIRVRHHAYGVGTLLVAESGKSIVRFDNVLCPVGGLAHYRVENARLVIITAEDEQAIHRRAA